MTHNGFRWLTVGLVACGEAGLVTLTAMMNSALAYGVPSPPLPPPIPVTTEVMGGSGNPIPGITGGMDYLPGMQNNFIFPNLPGTDPVVLATPEELYPLTGVKALTLDQSVSEGVTILHNAIQPDLTAGTPVGVFGYSQSAIIGSQEMQLLDPAGTPSDLPAKFVLAADPMNPDGGLLERFDGAQFPALGLNFYGLDSTFAGATPADDFPTTIYTGEYDGFADFPRYPLNFLADANAVLGIIEVHPNYAAQPSDEVQPVGDNPQAMAIQLPTLGDNETTYYVIPTHSLDPTLVTSGGSTYFTENLPLLEPLREAGGIGKALADLLQPDVTALVNLGYDNPANLGWDAGPANVPTEFGLFPSLGQVETALGQLLPGAEQGFQAFEADLSNPSSLFTPPSNLSSLLTDPFETTSPSTTPITSLTDFINALSSAASTAYATLLPTADVVNTLITSIPAYDASVFIENLSNPIDALGLPIAATTGMTTLLGGVEFLVLVQAASDIANDFGFSL
jgi:PE-PPE domain-containing protein